MAIGCEIHLDMTSNGIYKPGNYVTGAIKYNVNKTTTFTEIVFSLKGIGYTYITEGFNKGITHIHKETLVDIDNLITEKEKPLTVFRGAQRVQFHFVLPPNLPPSFKYKAYIGSEDINCKIHYYVRIKFKRAGTFELTKRFKKVLTVESDVIIPTLPRDPTVYLERKTLNQFFSNQLQMVTLKASINNSLIDIGGKVKFECQVANLTKLTVKSLDTKLIEVYRFYKNVDSKGTKVSKDVEGTVATTAPISQGQTHFFNFEFKVPCHKFSIENSRVMSRKYFVKIVAILPTPHKDVVLKIPLQIGSIDDDGLLSEAAGGSATGVHDQSALMDAPPSYWEVMREDKGDD